MLFHRVVALTLKKKGVLAYNREGWISSADASIKMSSFY